MTLTTLRLSESGQTIALRDQGQGEPLVLIHGVGMQSRAWGPQIDVLSITHRVIAVDMPGHGGSDPLPANSQLPDYVDWFATVVSALDVGPVNIAGHSMGALIAGGFAATRPQLARRVAFLNGVYMRDQAASETVIARAADVRSGKIDPETPLARWFGDSPTDIAARAQVAQWLGDIDPGGYATAYTAFAHGDATYADQLPNIACPVLALTADGDPNSTPAMSQSMAVAVQNGRAITIKGHRHMVNLTAPDMVTHHLAEWLNQPVA